MSDINVQLASLFGQMVDVMQILGVDRFRINAFVRAVRVLEDPAQDVAAIGPNVAALTKIEGIGKGMAGRIAEFMTTGRLREHETLMGQIPAGLLDLLDIQSLGPKTIAVLWKEAGVEGLDDLKAKLQGDELTSLSGLGKKKLENLRQSIAFAESTSGRVRIGQAMPLAQAFIEALQQHRQVKQVMYAGSLRRGQETIGDLDIIVAADPKDASGIADTFIGHGSVKQVLVKGATKISVRTTEHIQADLRIVAPEQFGAALMYFTGSKEHNISMRQRAIEHGMRLNEYGLHRDEQTIASETEQEVFEALGLTWIPAELREDRDELALAQDGKLPALLQVSDVKAELHAHTTASDGRWSIKELAISAADRGFHTVAITDHSKSQAQANGLSDQRLDEHIRAILKVRDELGSTINILAGSEVDILADGQLDYPNSLLGALDIVVASPHSSLAQDPEKATMRLLKAIDNPFVTILGHPTGRLISRRGGMSPDMIQVVAAAKDRGIALEINANSWRLDLRDTHARLAVEAGVKLAVNTDAHGPQHLDELIYGVMTARRAGATATDVINCMGKQDLANWLSKTRPYDSSAHKSV